MLKFSIKLVVYAELCQNFLSWALKDRRFWSSSMPRTQGFFFFSYPFRAVTHSSLFRRRYVPRLRPQKGSVAFPLFQIEAAPWVPFIFLRLCSSKNFYQKGSSYWFNVLKDIDYHCGKATKRPSKIILWKKNIFISHLCQITTVWNIKRWIQLFWLDFEKKSELFKKLRNLPLLLW